MSKQISITGIKGRDKALAGGYYMADLISSSLGPFGSTYSIFNGDKITNDGDLIATTFIPTIEDEFERRGANLAHKASRKSNEEVEDGSTSAWIFWRDITKEAVKLLPQEGRIGSKKSPEEVKRLIEKSRQEVMEKLKAKTIIVTSKEQLIHAARTSVGDEHIANLLGNMQFELRAYGRIIAEEVNDETTTIEKVKGIRIDNGFGTALLVTNPAKNSLELSNLPILLTNYVIDTKELDILTESCFKSLISQKKFGCILIGRAFTAAAIQKCQDSIQNGFGIFPVNAPYTNQNQVMKDIEAVVGGKYINTEETRLEDVYITDIGFCERFEANATNGLVAGTDTEYATVRIQKRVDFLTESLKGEKSVFYRKMIEERIAQLQSGFAILKVGAVSNVERARLKDKCDDAVSSVRLALKGGIVKGAGQALKEISDELSEDNILKRPMSSIYYQIMKSAPENWVIPEWVYDPYLSIESALKHACDVAGTMANLNGLDSPANPETYPWLTKQDEE